jgi:ankyrin repeat protein
MLAAENGHVETVELLLSTGRVQTDFDLAKMPRSSVFAPSKLNEDVVRVFEDYKSRHRGGPSLDS